MITLTIPEARRLQLAAISYLANQGIDRDCFPTERTREQVRASTKALVDKIQTTLGEEFDRRYQQYEKENAK